MSGNYSVYPSTSGGGSGGLSSVSFSVGVLDGQTATPNGASVSSNSIFMQSATATSPGLVSSAAQTFSGVKTFNQQLGLGALGSASLSAGQVVYDNSPQCLSFQNNVSSISLQIGQESWVQVQNSSGATIGNGRAVYITGSVANGDKPTIGLAIATTTSTSALLGLATHDIANGGLGYVTQTGKVHGLDTSAYSPGQRVWLSTASAGFFQVTDPLPPFYSVFVGYVLDIGSTTGSIFLSGIRAGTIVPFVNPMTTSGDMIVGSGSGVARRLAIGAVGNMVLTVASGSALPVWTAFNAIVGSVSGAAYVVGTIDGAAASANGAVIGTASLFMQSASLTAPGLVNLATQSFTGVKNFINAGINNASGSSSFAVVSSGLASISVYVKALPSQTADMFRIASATEVPSFLVDSAMNFKINHNQTAETQIDFRPSVSLTTINSGSAARYNMFLSDPAALAAGKGAGFSFGAIYSTSSAATELGYVWATKDNAAAGDNSASLHFATRNNATGNAQRCLDFDAGGNAVFSGSLAMTGSVSGKITIQAPALIGSNSYTMTLPVAQGSSSASYLQNDGAGTLSWSTVPTAAFTLTSGSAQTFNTPIGAKFLKVTIVGPGGGGGGVSSAAAQAAGGGGGGGGGTSIKYFSGNTISSTYSYTVANTASGGTAGANNGLAGSSSCFGSVSAIGGAGGGAGTANTGTTTSGLGAAGGGALNGDINIPGSGGGTGLIFGTGSQALSGAGGNSVYGYGGNALANANSGGANGTNYGGGGAGGVQNNAGSNQTGGNGAQGVIFVEVW